METSEQLSPTKRKRQSPPLLTALGPLPINPRPTQRPVADNTHAPRSRVVLDALPDGIVVDNTMKSLVRSNEALRDGLPLKDQEAADIDHLPRTLATATSNASTPARQPGTNADKEPLDTVRHQVQTLQQQQEEIKTMPDTYIQGAATANGSAVMQLLREIQQQQIEMQAALQQQHEQYKANLLAALHRQNQQHQADMLAALQKQIQQQQSAQNTALERRELELLRTARAQDGEMSRDLKAHLDSWVTAGDALRERVWAGGAITADHDEGEGVAGETGIKVDDAAEVFTPTTRASLSQQRM